MLLYMVFSTGCAGWSLGKPGTDRVQCTRHIICSNIRPAFLKIGIMVPETCRSSGLLINYNLFNLVGLIRHFILRTHGHANIKFPLISSKFILRNFFLFADFYVNLFINKLVYHIIFGYFVFVYLVNIHAAFFTTGSHKKILSKLYTQTETCIFVSPIRSPCPTKSNQSFSLQSALRQSIASSEASSPPIAI